MSVAIRTIAAVFSAAENWTVPESPCPVSPAVIVSQVAAASTTTDHVQLGPLVETSKEPVPPDASMLEAVDEMPVTEQLAGAWVIV